MTRISRALAVAMINCDYSGLNEEEIDSIKNFKDFKVIDWNEESNDINGRCNISGKFDHCVEIEIINNSDSLYILQRY